MPNRSIAIPALIAFALASVACTARDERSDGDAHPVPALRFAGVDLVYALRRMAAEADLILVLDEIRPRDSTRRDLAFARLDMDLAAAPIRENLDRIRARPNVAFDYSIRDGLLLVRSARAVDARSALDLPGLPAASIEVDLEGLIRWLMEHSPATLLRMGERRGQPIFRKVRLEIAAGSSALDVFLAYARALDWGLRIRRAGYAYGAGEAPAGRLPPPQGRAERPGPTVVANTIGLLEPLAEPRPLSKHRMAGATIWSLAELASRSGEIFCVFDRSPLLDNRGSLNYTRKVDRGLPLHEALDALASQGPGKPPDYRWERADGVFVLKARLYEYFVTGRDLMGQKLEAGEVEGTLGDLVRYINSNRIEPSRKLLLAGEVTDAFARARLEITEGMTVEQALVAFAGAARESWVAVTRDTSSPDKELQGTWAGFYLTRLEEWGPNGQLPIN